MHLWPNLPPASLPGHCGAEAMPVVLCDRAGEAAARPSPGDGRPSRQELGSQGGRLGPPHEAPAGRQASHALFTPAGGAQKPNPAVWCQWRCAEDAAGARWRRSYCGKEAADLSKMWWRDQTG